MYSIVFKNSAIKELRNIDRQFAEKIIQKIELLKNDPYPPQSRKLVGSDSCYRI